MHVKHGDMWLTSIPYNEAYVTGNSLVKTNGLLVMGRGAAKEAALRYPRLPVLFGEIVADKTEYLLIPPPAGHNVGLFQVKYRPESKADLELIKYSAMALAVRARLHPLWRFALNYPGVGAGRLRYEDVAPVIEWILPDNVDVWLYATKRQLANAGLEDEG